MSALSILEQAGGDWLIPPIVLEASVPLELSGEAVRGRICTFSDEEGREWALRPDMTLPVAMAEIDARRQGTDGTTTRRYAGPVFRLPVVESEPMEFTQIGLEVFGADTDAQTDADLFNLISEACRSEGVSEALVQTGDLTIFPAFVDALGLSAETRAGLKRAFRQEGGVRAFLNADRAAISGLATRMRGMSLDEAAAFVDDIFALTGIQPVGERTGEEIVERMQAQASHASGVDLRDEDKAVLLDVLEVEAPIFEALARLRDIADKAKLGGVASRLDALEARLNLMSEKATNFMKEARFATRFGRRFTYYDGFVFELTAAEAKLEKLQPFAAGGRYDALLHDLSGGEVSVSAIGGVIMPHRLDAAKGRAT